MVGEIVSISVTAIVGEGWGLPGVDSVLLCYSNGRRLGATRDR